MKDQNNTYALTRSLKAAGYHVQTCFEETTVVTKIRSAMHDHFLLITARRSDLAVKALQVVQSLRRIGYEWPIAYCVNETISSAERRSYAGLPLNGVWSVPAEYRSPILTTLDWIAGHLDLDKSGITILEN